MWTETNVFAQDLACACAKAYIPWEQLRGKKLLVTGGTGLIGSTLISLLLYAGREKQLGLQVTALVRDCRKAEALFAAQLDEKLPLVFAEGSVEALPPFTDTFDFIIHGASPTASAYFVQKPVDTIHTAVYGTENLLRLAKEHDAGLVYLSSMEAYGSPTVDKVLKEDDLCVIDTMNPRSCYPESKRMCEMLCTAYSAQFGVRANAIRLAQTFGPGVARDDVRVFAEFARCSVQHRDIVLKTAGTSQHPYLYTMDAAMAIITVMLLGRPGQVYNAANPDTHCSIREMGALVAQWFSDGHSHVVIDMDEEALKRYPATNYLKLSVEKIEALGWKAEKGLRQMYERMLVTMYD